MQKAIQKVVERWLDYAFPGELWRLNVDVNYNELSFLHTNIGIHVIDELTLPHECACYQPVVVVCPRFNAKMCTLVDQYRMQGLPVLLITRSNVYMECDADHFPSL